MDSSVLTPQKTLILKTELDVNKLGAREGASL